MSHTSQLQHGVSVIRPRRRQLLAEPQVVAGDPPPVLVRLPDVCVSTPSIRPPETAPPNIPPERPETRSRGRIQHSSSTGNFGVLYKTAVAVFTCIVLALAYLTFRYPVNDQNKSDIATTTWSESHEQPPLALRQLVAPSDLSNASDTTTQKPATKRKKNRRRKKKRDGDRIAKTPSNPTEADTESDQPSDQPEDRTEAENSHMQETPPVESPKLKALPAPQLTDGTPNTSDRSNISHSNESARPASQRQSAGQYRPDDKTENHNSTPPSDQSRYSYPVANPTTANQYPVSPTNRYPANATYPRTYPYTPSPPGGVVTGRRPDYRTGRLEGPTRSQARPPFTEDGPVGARLQGTIQPPPINR